MLAVTGGLRLSPQRHRAHRGRTENLDNLLNYQYIIIVDIREGCWLYPVVYGLTTETQSAQRAHREKFGQFFESSWIYGCPREMLAVPGGLRLSPQRHEKRTEKS